MDVAGGEMRGKGRALDQGCSPFGKDEASAALGPVCRVGEAQRARLNPGASGIFQPRVLLDAYSQFEKQKKKSSGCPFSLWSCRLPFSFTKSFFF